MQCLACVISIAAIFIDGLDNAADIIRFIANLVFQITAGCMVRLSLEYATYQLTFLNCNQTAQQHYGKYTILRLDTCELTGDKRTIRKHPLLADRL